MLLDILRDDQASESDLLLATELAGDFTVIDDALVDVLLSVFRGGDKSEKVRWRAVISLGPVLEQADTEGFEDGDHLSITEGTFHAILAQPGRAAAGCRGRGRSLTWHLLRG